MKLPGKPLDADGFHEFNFDDNCQKGIFHYVLSNMSKFYRPLV